MINLSKHWHNSTNNENLSFLLIPNQALGWRECVRLVKAAKHHDCVVTLYNGERHGSTKSLLSLIRLGVAAGRLLTISVIGKHEQAALAAAQKILFNTTTFLGTFAKEGKSHAGQ